MAIITSFFFRNTYHEYSFRFQWYGGQNEIICGHVETSESDECANAREVTMKVKSGYVALYGINGTMKTVLMSKIISSRYIIRLYYLLITCYIYIAEILFIS